MSVSGGDVCAMNCPDCGKENPEMTKFCVRCGHQFDLPAAKGTSRISTSELAEISSSEETHPTSPVTHEAPTQDISRKDFLLMVVDDSVDNLVLISLHLQQAGYRVITASNGEEAVRVAQLSMPDLILMDIGMPELDGLGATRKIRTYEQLQNVPVIALTAFSTEGFQRAAYDAGIDGYLTKPINFDRLAELVKSLLPVR